MNNKGMPTEQDADNAIVHIFKTLPEVSKAIDSLSKRQLKRFILSLLKHPVEDILLTEDKEIELFEKMLTVMNANLLVMSYAAELKQKELESKNG